MTYSHAATLVECESKEAWLEARRTLITASDAAALIGRSPFSNYEDVVRKKITGETLTQTRPMWYGLAREKANLEILSDCSNIHAAHCGELWRHKDITCLGATLDGMVTSIDEEDLREALGIPEDCWIDLPLEHIRPGTPIEMKNVASKNRSLWNKESPPLIYYCQMQHQMLVVGHPVGILAAAVDSCELYVHVIYRDRATQEEIIDAAQKAHKEVMSWL